MIIMTTSCKGLLEKKEHIHIPQFGKKHSSISVQSSVKHLRYDSLLIETDKNLGSRVLCLLVIRELMDISLWPNAVTSQTHVSEKSNKRPSLGQLHISSVGVQCRSKKKKKKETTFTLQNYFVQELA